TGETKTGIAAKRHKKRKKEEGRRLGGAPETVLGSRLQVLDFTKQTRHFQFEGSRLILNADTEWGQVQIVWERMDTAPETA
ncbi:MAG TPA: hypothetical protein VE641_08615, partial [Chthoniobacterales bacterium]|nr:hypothetical protein [Chthoniobacterales bacterium]